MPHCHKVNLFVSRFVAPEKKIVVLQLLCLESYKKKQKKMNTVETMALTVDVLLIKSVIIL